MWPPLICLSLLAWLFIWGLCALQVFLAARAPSLMARSPPDAVLIPWAALGTQCLVWCQFLFFPDFRGITMLLEFGMSSCHCFLLALKSNLEVLRWLNGMWTYSWRHLLPHHLQGIDQVGDFHMPLWLTYNYWMWLCRDQQIIIGIPSWKLMNIREKQAKYSLKR